MSTKSQRNTRKKTAGSDESWRNGSIAQRSLHMLNSESMADCTFVVGGVKKKKFQCHKSILSHGSSVFYAMFNGGLQEKGEVKVEDIEQQHFRKMLEYIYSDNTELENVEIALSVCYAANKYMINTLTQKCIDFIKENLDTDSVCRALEFARHFDNTDMETESLKYLQTNTSDVLKSTSFPHVERATLLTILAQENLCITSEVELYSACLCWAKAQQRDTKVTLREVLGPDMLSLIRFLTLTAQEFATIVVPSKILQLQDEHDILCCLVTGTGNVPRGFNSNMTRRTAIGPREIIKLEHGCLSTSSGNHITCNGVFRFNVNVESYIFGLQLQGLASGNPPVQDNFEINLLLSSDILASVKFEGQMSPDKSVEVNFKKPFLLKPNTSYTLKGVYSNLHSPSYKVRYGDETSYTTPSGVRMYVCYYQNTPISQIYIGIKGK